MTVSESNGTSIEIVNPNTILFPTRIYPIPKKQIGINIPIKFSVSINHTNSNYFYLNHLQALIPELLTSNGQRMQGHLVTDDLVTNQQSKKLCLGICASLSLEAKDKSHEKMDLADAVGADGSCRGR
ncbi:hypothetical protein H6G97_15995 [Nostoc flagelliforme FACHB-838]|uniref:Uncharacterized protein n=1 Tax=Nostoc flagelliforme FACHB-838 TaxID=2692904 RepID=A0ABR8DS27_9NOSO|nr:hypothetical protein [Nostoc flagelliforme]MBD2531000.1 hypothetical protein [Nostoc flagelliforme FACHB-838]